VRILAALLLLASVAHAQIVVDVPVKLRRTRLELQESFRELQRRLGKTAIFVTHDLREAARVADRMALMSGGTLVAVGTREELEDHRHPEVAAFLRTAQG
jgi:ABC-type proline/glycine betaine transport system ATPase subunit